MWTIRVFLPEPLGLLLIRALFDWPSLGKYPSCGKKRVVTRERCEHCEHCNSPFTAPLPDGTEIVESAPKVPALRLAS